MTLYLETERFYLRPLSLDDVTPRYINWLQDKEITAWINARFNSTTPESIRAYVQRCDNITTYHLGIFVRGGIEHIGNYTIQIQAQHDTARTNVLIGEKDWWGKGVVIETRARLLD